MKSTRIAVIAALSLTLAASIAGCGGDEESCTTAGCDDGLVCEEVEGGEPTCFAQVSIEGRVIDALDPAPGIAGARVVAIDANGAARSSVVISAADGAYSLPVSARRDANGVPLDDQLTLRADAAGYQTFPTAPRTAIPIDLGDSSDADGDGDYEIRNAATDLALLPRTGLTGTATVRGTLQATDPGGALVIAEAGGRAAATAISSDDGTFVLFDVPAGTASIDAYRAGLDVAAVEVTVAAPETTGVVLTGTAGGATVTGSVQIVNAPGGSETSVILVVESTFVENAARGEAPPGLRAAPVSGSFTIEGVPPGRYVALAAFENDGLVRDPDTSIGGTEIVHFEVPATGGEVVLGESFKVTGALAVLSPGAAGIETITDAQPTFTWEDDSSEDGYELRVFDAFGNMVHEATNVPRVSGSADVTYTWTGAELQPGMVYQFRAWSFHDEAAGHVLISATEDLRGVFVYQP